MGRKSTKNKKDRPALFPEFEQVEKEITKKLSIGTRIKIGKPSNRYFQYIYRSLNFFNLKLSDLTELVPLEGTRAKVVGMIQMVNGDEIAIIAKRDNSPFFKNYIKLFVDRELALDQGEITISD